MQPRTQGPREAVLPCGSFMPRLEVLRTTLGSTASAASAVRHCAMHSGSPAWGPAALVEAEDDVEVQTYPVARAVPVGPTDPVAEDRCEAGEQPAPPEGGVVKDLHWSHLTESRQVVVDHVPVDRLLDPLVREVASGDDGVRASPLRSTSD